MIKTLEQPKGLSLEETQKYRDVNESVIYESCFEENFGQNAFIYSEDLHNTQHLTEAGNTLFEILKDLINESLEDKTFCEAINNTIVIKKGYLKKYKQEKINELKKAVDKLKPENYWQVKYELQNILRSEDCHVFPTTDSDSSFIQPIDKWIEYCAYPDRNTIIQVVGAFEVKE